MGFFMAATLTARGIVGKVTPFPVVHRLGAKALMIDLWLTDCLVLCPQMC
jgi:hypothetical protein